MDEGVEKGKRQNAKKNTVKCCPQCGIVITHKAQQLWSPPQDCHTVSEVKIPAWNRKGHPKSQP